MTGKVSLEIPAYAIAVGAGSIKGASASEFTLIRSLIIKTLPRGLTPNSELLNVQIKNSSHCNGSFVIGEELEDHIGTQPLKHGSLKADYTAPIALAIAAYLARGNAALSCRLVVSAPTAEIKKSLEESLPGLHTVIVNDYEVITLHVLSVKVIPEGIGSAYALAKDVPISGIDFGYHNTSATGWDPIKNKPLCHHSLTPGVGDLFEAIATELNTDGQRFSAEAVRLGVDARTYKVYGHGDVEFKAVYNKCFEQWIREVLSQVKDVAYSTIQRCPHKYFFGGGSQLPGMTEIAQGMGFEVVEEPQKLEVTGLLK